MMVTIHRRSPRSMTDAAAGLLGPVLPAAPCSDQTSALSFRLEGGLSGSSRRPRDRSILPGAVVSDKARRSFIEPLARAFLAEISNSLELD